MLGRHPTRPQHALQLRDIQPKHRHRQRKPNRRQQIPILRLPLPHRRMLEDTQPPCPDRQQHEPLHDDQVYEVDRGGFCEFLRGVGGIDGGGQRAVAEPEGGEGDGGALEVPVGHGEGGEGFEDAEEAVGLEDEAPVDEAVGFGAAGSAEEDVGFGGLVGEDGGGGAVSKAAVAWLE